MGATSVFPSTQERPAPARGCLKRDGRRDDPRRDAVPDDEEGTRRGGPLFCARCGYVITAERERTEVSGAHEHTFVNPAGVVFHIGCFERAPGCGPEGPPSAFFSWFPGYEWRVVACRDCRSHLGWSFGTPPSFYGLILDRLVDEP